MKVNAIVNCLVTNIVQISFYVQQKKNSYVWNNLRVSKCVNYPF